MIIDFIKPQYHPCDATDEFGRGFAAYQADDLWNPNEPDSVSARAWDCDAASAKRCGKAAA
jgi:hypothetical protein